MYTKKQVELALKNCMAVNMHSVNECVTRTTIHLRNPVCSTHTLFIFFFDSLRQRT